MKRSRIGRVLHPETPRHRQNVRIRHCSQSACSRRRQPARHPRPHTAHRDESTNAGFRSVDIRRRHANRPRRDPRTARACQRALQSPRSSPTKARVVKTEKRTADERAMRYPVQGHRAFLLDIFKRLQHLCLCVTSVKIGHPIPGEVHRVQLAGAGLLAVKAASVS